MVGWILALLACSLIIWQQIRHRRDRHLWQKVVGNISTLIARHKDIIDILSHTIDESADEYSEFIKIDPEIKGGLPCIAGTRIPVYAVLARVRGGDGLAMLEEEYPYINPRAFRVAVAYAIAHPQDDQK